MKVKTTHVIGALLVMGIIVTGYYYFTQVQQVPQGQVTKFEQYAEDLGLDLQQFSSCLDSGKFKDEVQSDFNDGRLYGVDGTPTFFVAGERAPTNTLEALSALIEAKMEQQKL